MIPNIGRKVKEFVSKKEGDIILFLSVFLGIMLIAGLFYIYGAQGEKYPIRMREVSRAVEEESALRAYIAAEGLSGLIAASSKGTRYYYPWCGGVSRLSEKNKIWFDTPEEAEKAGYTIASGCSGL
ncbi:MAG: hypothetical protein COU90_04655 [Candidatus Ryanbacteria bacterium CG10_big_fil_rev_8_21_14_0_10_43_42]|uniref:Ada DNA repair metal-binding domain-containing protein n=1 Tax=Candidatus Ryanbacteria bacterium CG10_big_fil_rev_8_21_14_0_10_43_42 TaxID=1974864 RepID=A0A2M8KW48_9BACT|nr:MAG: hypothetical protein COU90_04655 [Candidatus Ryanbacteria bacterium CG10_big_fil_rev_8_21_14_0_10_43_42]